MVIIFFWRSSRLNFSFEDRQSYSFYRWRRRSLTIFKAELQLWRSSVLLLLSMEKEVSDDLQGWSSALKIVSLSPSLDREGGLSPSLSREGEFRISSAISLNRRIADAFRKSAILLLRKSLIIKHRWDQIYLAIKFICLSKHQYIFFRLIIAAVNVNIYVADLDIWNSF